MRCVLLPAMALWIGPSILAGAIRDGRQLQSSRGVLAERDATDFKNTFHQDAASTQSLEGTSPDEICCVCGSREFTMSKSVGCPPECGQRGAFGGCTVADRRPVIYKTTPTPTTTAWKPSFMCCVCQVGFGWEEITLPAGSTCPSPCTKKKGLGTTGRYDTQGDSQCSV